MRLAALCLVLAIGAGCARAVTAAQPPLRVCSDPNNLPFSNQQQQGFENRIADLLARDLGTTVEYTWWAQRRGFLRNTLLAGLCDVVIGLPRNVEMATTTQPYYRSTYVFVTRKARGLHIRSFDDAALRQLRVGVQVIGDDGANSPPAHALSRRGIVNNLIGYSVYGDYAADSPPSRIVAAVASGEVDVAAVWGPLAGYFAAEQREPLDIVPVSPQIDGRLPQAFDLSMAVRRNDTARLAVLNQFLQRHRADINRILDIYHVPRASLPEVGT
ncbi:MAG TPA: substrate-binding domain-containing protein [Vicinamibacterales bacterium]|nr:substrate-binding domain-containing protein [Vicinamibacterales bacterium]